MKSFFCFALASVTMVFNVSIAQTPAINDSIYHGLRVYESTLPNVLEQLGPPTSQKEMTSTRYAKFRDGTCVTSIVVSGYALYYRKIEATIYIKKKHNWVEEIHLGSSADFSSVKGIRARKNSFADVLTAYGPVDFDKKDNNFPKLQQESDGKKHLIKLMYPGISFVSYGVRQPEENLSLRRVDEIWLE